MAVLERLFRSIKISSYEDNYGGNAFDNYYYSYILFKNNLIYIFSSSPMYSSSKLKPIQSFNDAKTIKNIKVILKNATYAEYKKTSKNEIIFNLPAQVVGEQGEIISVNRIYKLIIENDGKLLSLNAYNENSPNLIVIDMKFEKI